MTKKSSLRQTYGALRATYSSEQLQEKSIALANQCLKLPIWKGKYYHLFLTSSTQPEVDTEPLLAILQSKDKEIIVPKVEDSNNLSHYLLTDSTLLKTNRWGIPEPQEGIVVSPSIINVVFVPLFIFDLQGHRVGYGKGYYDRFLSKCPKETIKVGLSFFEPIPEIEDRTTFDVPLDFGVTSEGTFCFGGQ